MSLQSEFEKTGAWLFKYRSFLPLLTVPIIVAGMNSFSYLGRDHRLNEVWQLACFTVSLSGLLIRIATVGHAPAGTSGRNTRSQVAETLNTTGMYSIVRHPLYLGNYLAMLGFALFFHNPWIAFLATTIFALYYERIMFAEEAFLRAKFGACFETWAESTPAFIPRLHGWRSCPLSFCWRTALRREYTGFFLITSGFFLLDLVGDAIVDGRIAHDWFWDVAFVTGTMSYFTLRFLKKSTRLLHVNGR